MIATREQVKAALPTRDKSLNTFYPMGGAWELCKSHDKELLIDGPAGTGKTRACCEKAHAICSGAPGVRILFIRQTRASMTESVLVTFEEKVLPAGHPFKLRGGSRRYKQSYEYPNGSVIVLGGLDNIDRVMSTEYDMIFVFEATETSLSDWESLQSRLRNGVLPFQQAVADCNPSHPRHWLIMRAMEGKMRRIQSRFEDNPTIDDEYLRTLAGLTGHRRARLFEGLWAAAEGLVYPLFDECFIPHFDPPEGRHIGGIDFGFKAPFAALGATQYYDENGRDCIYVWYQRYKSKTEIRDHAHALPSGHRWFCDPSEPDQIFELSRVDGVRVARAKNSIVTGINAVTRRMTDGTLLISERCSALRLELAAYAYPEEKADTEKPVDEFNHACDALRYLVMGVDRGQVAR